MKRNSQVAYRKEATVRYAHVVSAGDPACSTVTTVKSVLKVDVCLTNQVVTSNQIPVHDLHLHHRVMRKCRLDLETSTSQSISALLQLPPLRKLIAD